MPVFMMALIQDNSTKPQLWQECLPLRSPGVWRIAGHFRHSSLHSDLASSEVQKEGAMMPVFFLIINHKAIPRPVRRLSQSSGDWRIVRIGQRTRLRG